MNIGPNLIESIDKNGELPFAIRQEILLALDLESRKELAFSAAEFVKSIWEAKFPEDKEPYQLLESIHGNTLRADFSADFHLGDLQNHLDEQFSLGESFAPAIYAGYAAWSACYVLIGDEDLTAEDDEQKSDPDSWGPGFYASCAYSGGAWWDRVQGDSSARRQFWEWYIGRATELDTRSARNLQ